MSRVLAILVVIAIVTLSGCIIGGDKIGIANEMKQSREQVVTNGLLLPHTPEGKQAYRTTLIGFRSKINAIGEGKAALQAYLDGSLDLLEMQKKLEVALERIKQVNPDFVECNTGSPATQALEQFRAAKEKSQSAHDAFALVQEDIALTNALGADYVLTAIEATAATDASLTNTIDQIQQSCV